MKKIIFSFLILSVVILSLPLLLNAETPQPDKSLENLNSVARQAGLQSQTVNPASPMVIVLRIVQMAMGFVGLIFFIQIFTSGFQWMTSAANPEKIKKAKARITNAVMGLAILLAAYLITGFIIHYLVLSTAAIR
ncbi:MAG: hypothetical protein NTV81_00160 [Candidatus Komeilibacteria bacterium]|nr:hypothetical protein [Candidatus Komeilibacteria bacterium]